MKHAIKASLALALACFLMLGVSACGGGGDSTTSSKSGSPDLEGTVTMWDLAYETYPEYTKAIEQIDREFEKANPKVKVERVNQPEEGYAALVRTTLLSGETPDAMTLYPGGAILTFAESLEPLNDRISPELEEVIGNWSSVTPGLTEEGTHYGVPSSPNGTAFYYNKKLFAKAGLPTDFHPESWDELREAGEKLKAAGIQPFADGDKGGEILSQFMFGLGLQTENTEEEISGLQDKTIPYTDPKIAKAFEPYVEFYEAGLYSPEIFDTQFIEGFTAFEEEKAGMVLGLWSVIGSYAQFDEKLGEKNVGIFPAPGVDSYSSFASQPRAIPKAAKNKDAAWALLEFEASKRSQEILVNKGGSWPIRTDVSLPPDTPSQGLELAEAAENREVVVFPLLVLSENGVSVLSSEFAQVVQGRSSIADIQQAIQEAEERSDT
jgi:ABC-type glycerol-3-phosphate transport system substrate-binding protein